MLTSRHAWFGRFEQRQFAKGSSPGMWAVSDAELGASLRYLSQGKTPEQKKLLGILEQMQNLAKIEPPIFSEKIAGPTMAGNLPNPAFGKVAQKKYKLQLEIERRKTVLNTDLARYRFTPYVFTGLGANQLVVTWHRDWRREYEPGKPPDRMIEGQALELILNLARSRRLDRLRRCAHCNNWLYARFRHQIFCSTKCQQKQYTQTNEFKAHRREYMREYYQRTFGGKRKSSMNRKGRPRRRG